MWAQFRRISTTLFAAAVIGSLPVVAVAVENDFPDKGAEAMAFYENNVDEWLQGPVLYIALDEEAKAFKQLESTEARAQFIGWFWARRDSDPSDELHPFKIEFYERVAEANRRYNDFPRGWRSDRGWVHVILGRPDAVRPRLGRVADTSVWTYYTIGPRADERSFGSAHGEVSIAFLRRGGRGGYEIFGGFGGPGLLPMYVRDAFRYTRQATILNPLLELTAAG